MPRSLGRRRRVYVGSDGPGSRCRTASSPATPDLTPRPGQAAGTFEWPDVYGAVTSLGGNLIGDGTGSTGWSDERPGWDRPHAGRPGLNAPGVTPTHALLEGSPAIDAAPTCAAETDQRGVTRPQGALVRHRRLRARRMDTTPPVLTITGATADGIAMTGDLETGYILPTTNDPAVDHLIQFAAGQRR